MPNNLARILLVTVFACVFSLGIHTSYAADFPFMEKLQQCEAAFKASRNKSVTQEEGTKAREKHIKLTMEILQNLNAKNIEATDQGRAPTITVIQ